MTDQPTGDSTLEAHDVQSAQQEVDGAGPQPRSLIWMLAALAIVWAATAIAFALHVTVIAAAVWFVAAIVVLPIGSRVADRIVAIVVSGAAIIVLVAWVSPWVPLLVHPVVLAGVLGSVPAVVLARGRSRRPRILAADYVALACGVAGGVLWWLPMRGASPAGIINVLFFGPDNAAHVTMLRGVWLNHGYEIVDAGPRSFTYIYQTYPQGAHAILSTVGSVLTGSAQPLTIDNTLRLYALLVAVQAGLLAFLLAWGVERIARRAVRNHPVKVGIAQAIPPAFLIVGPGAFILISSVSFVNGLIMVIAGAVIAATTRSHPRRSALFLGFAVIAICAAYPLLAVFVPPIWLCFLWTTRSFWLRHRWWTVGVTLAVALASAPMFILLVTREVPHSITSPGVFEPIPIVVFVAMSCALGSLLILGSRWLPYPVHALAWLTSAVTFVFIVGAILNWAMLGRVQYYTAKSMYASVLMAVLVLCSAGAVIACRWQPAVAKPQRRWARAIAIGSGIIMFATSIFSGILLNTVEESPLRPIYRVVPGAMWVGRQPISAGLGEVALQLAEFSQQRGDIPIVMPCDVRIDKWLLTLVGGPTDEQVEVVERSCDPEKLAQYLAAHPTTRVDAFTSKPTARDELLALKRKYELGNLTVVGVNLPDDRPAE